MKLNQLKIKKSIVDYLCYDLIAKQNSTRRISTMKHQNHNIESRKNKHLNLNSA